MKDEEINRLVAEKVMGLHVHPVTDNHYPDYCNSWEAMGEVIEKFPTHVKLNKVAEHCWYVDICIRKEGSWYYYEAKDKSAPKAVALAALKAKGISVE